MLQSFIYLFIYLYICNNHLTIDWGAKWNVLRMYGVGGRLLNGGKVFYIDTKATVISSGWRNG